MDTFISYLNQSFPVMLILLILCFILSDSMIEFIAIFLNFARNALQYLHWWKVNHEKQINQPQLLFNYSKKATIRFKIYLTQHISYHFRRLLIFNQTQSLSRCALKPYPCWFSTHRAD